MRYRLAAEKFSKLVPAIEAGTKTGAKNKNRNSRSIFQGPFSAQSAVTVQRTISLAVFSKAALSAFT